MPPRRARGQPLHPIFALSLKHLEAPEDGARVTMRIRETTGVRSAEFVLYDAELAVIYDPARTQPEAIQGAISAMGIRAEVGSGKGTYAPPPAYPSSADVKTIAPDGEDVDITAHLGPAKITVVVFYAPWCPPCRRSEERLSALAAVRTDLAVRRVTIKNPECPAAQRYFGEHLVLPHLRIFDAKGRPAASLTGGETNDLPTALEKAAGAR